MNCPDCNVALVPKNSKNIPMQVCPKCQGMWLDATELEKLEDKAFYDDDDLKGTLVFKLIPSDRACPQCGNKMKKFNYRFYDLELETCEQNHGYWLDKGEETRVVELMKDEEKSLHNKLNAEQRWANALQHFRTPGFLDKVKFLLEK